jgi:hypothetical protein
VHLTAEVRYAADIARVGAMLADPDFVAAKVRASGALSQHVEVVHTSPDAFTVTTRRNMPTTGIPAQFRSLAGSSIEVRLVEAWEAQRDEERRGTIVVEIIGAPVRLTGTLRLTSGGDGSTTQYLDGDLRASVLLFASAVEDATARAVTEAAKAEERTAAAWLAT